MARTIAAKKTARSTEPTPRKHRIQEVAEHSSAIRKLMERFPDVLTVTDATEGKLLLVTDTDVRNGQSRNPAACAVAQCALRNGLGGLIGRKFAYLITKHEATRYQLGKDAQVRTAVFDDRGTMTPGPVLLSAPCQGQRLGVMARRMAISRVSAKRRRKPKNAAVAGNQKRDEAVRQAIVTHGFRSWDQA